MKVLVCGAGGFIGGRIVAALRDRGHEVVEGRSTQMNFGKDVDVATWRPRVAGLDAVINAVGVLRDTRARPMAAVHHHAPAALFQACAEQGVRRVIQVSALGIDQNPTQYAQSKLAAEAVLAELAEQKKLVATILRPSIVYGRGGASAQLFMMLARLPVLVLPGAALRALVQPVAVGDLATVCAALPDTEAPRRMDCVGPRRLTLAEFIASLRAQLGMRPAKVIAMPEWMSQASARCGDLLPFQPWCSETSTLLQKDNVGEGDAFAALLQRPAIAPEDLVATSWRS